MRTTRHIKTTKCTYRHKVRKKRHKSRSTLGCTPGVSFLDLENINEVLRVNRIHVRQQRADGKGTWKVVPKDSCEVYKERRKRQAENSRREDEGDADMQSDSDDTASGGGKKRRDDKKCRKASTKKTRRRRKPTCRCGEHSSRSSFTTTTTSCMSSSEMDYE